MYLGTGIKVREAEGKCTKAALLMLTHKCAAFLHIRGQRAYRKMYSAGWLHVWAEGIHAVALHFALQPNLRLAAGARPDASVGNVLLCQGRLVKTEAVYLSHSHTR